MKWIGFFCGIVFPFVGWGQTFNSARITGLGGSASAVTDIGQLIGNPAGVSSLNNWQILISHKQDRFHDQVSTQNLLLAMPFGATGLGLRFSRFGFEDLYNARTTGVVYGRRFGPGFSIGMGFQHHVLKIPNYVNHQDYTLDVGFCLAIHDHWKLGVHGENVAFLTDRAVHVDRPMRVRIGLSYDFNAHLLMIGDLKYDTQVGPQAHWGMEYALVQQSLFLRGGLSTKPFQQYAGIGFLKSNWGSDIALVFHPYLGWSSQIDLHYAF